MAPMRKDIASLSGGELDRLVRGFKGIMDLPPSDPNSYTTIAGYHGLPSPQFCIHHNVLFPLWHRAYLLRLERAIRAVLKDDDFAMPFWNEISPATAKGGLPSIFTTKTYIFSDGSGSIDNPLFSFKLKEALQGFKDKPWYSKPKGYETRRYPWSGLVEGKFAGQTAKHNAYLQQMPHAAVTAILNNNIVTWLTKETYINHKGEKLDAGEINKYRDCLKAPNYTVFSNTTSADDWNENRRGSSTDPVVITLEEPHDALHLGIGGLDIPNRPLVSLYPFANGDMGVNDMASWDPIFWFHHGFIDYMLWQWQVIHQQTKDLPIDHSLKGTENLSLKTFLQPFSAKEINGQDRPVQGQDIVDISALGYEYPYTPHELGDVAVDAPKLRVKGFDRRRISGSFMITTWAKGEDLEPDRLVHVKPVLSRWDVEGCDNCMDDPESLKIRSHIHLLDYTQEEAEKTKWFTIVVSNKGPDTDGIHFVDDGEIEVEVTTAATAA